MLDAVNRLIHQRELRCGGSSRSTGQKAGVHRRRRPFGVRRARAHDSYTIDNAATGGSGLPQVSGFGIHDVIATLSGYRTVTTPAATAGRAGGSRTAGTRSPQVAAT